jgi:DNA-binding IclR family transcriptional regulator
VLDGAFELLEALADAPAGAGLSDLARDTGLPKATTYRLLEQLVGRGAVQRQKQRYYVGATMARIGRQWQPSPALRRASLTPVGQLARLAGVDVAVCVLDGDTIRVVSASSGISDAMHRMSTSDELVVRTAAGRVLLAARTDRDRPTGFSQAEWNRTRDSMSRHAAIAVDHQDILPGVFCAAAAIPLSDHHDIAAIGALSIGRSPRPDLTEMVLRAARDVSRALALPHAADQRSAPLRPLMGARRASAGRGGG